MGGIIYFSDLSELAEFLKEFTGSSATFDVEKNTSGFWVLTFNGGF